MRNYFGSVPPEAPGDPIGWLSGKGKGRKPHPQYSNEERLAKALAAGGGKISLRVRFEIKTGVGAGSWKELRGKRFMVEGLDSQGKVMNIVEEMYGAVSRGIKRHDIPKRDVVGRQEGSEGMGQGEVEGGREDSGV